MKITWQEEEAFRPIALVLETEGDALLLLDIMSLYISVGTSEKAHQMAVRIIKWLENEAKL